jgi:hypothetical protein
MTLPFHLEEIRQAVTKPDGIEAVAKLFNLPTSHDLPRPGVVAAWGYDEWRKLLEPYGFVVGGRTTHSHTLLHPRYQIIFGWPTSPGDCRGAMNCASEIRRKFDKVLRDSLILLKAGLSLCARDELPDCDLSDQATWFENWTVYTVDQPAPKCLNDETHANVRSVSPEHVNKLLKVAEKEFGWTARTTLEKCGMPLELIELVLKSAKFALDLPEQCEAMITVELREIVDLERAAQLADKEARRKTKAAKQLGPTPKESYQAAVASYRVGLGREAQSMRNLLETVQAKLVKHLDTVALTTLPEYPAEVDTLTQQVAEQLEKINAQQTLIDDLSAKLAKRADQPVERWRGVLAEFLDLVQPSLSKPDLMGLAMGVADVRSRADSIASLLLAEMTNEAKTG